MADTRERILDATLELWNERGFTAVPVADLAAAAGMSNGNLSYHFPSKRDLVVALYDRAEKAHLELVREWEPATALRVLPGWIRDLTAEMWRYRFLYRDAPHLFAVAPEIGGRARSTLIFEGRRQFQAGIEALLEAGQLRIEPDDLPTLVTTGWILVRHWIDYLVEARGVHHIRRSHLDELVGQYMALLRPYLTPAARSFAQNV
jgi:AcrR family transcriptional regulator